jgi:hypothetical protein
MAEVSHRLHQPQVGAMADVIHLPTSLSSDEVRFAVVVLADSTQSKSALGRRSVTLPPRGVVIPRALSASAT